MNNHNQEGDEGEMTVKEAGRMGGERVSELVEEGKEAERARGEDGMERDEF